MARKNIPPEQYFSLCTGVLLKNIKELAFALDYLSDEELGHHVNADKNDFSTWIHHVFKEKKLARKLSQVQDRKDMQLILLKHIVR